MNKLVLMAAAVVLMLGDGLILAGGPAAGPGGINGKVTNEAGSAVAGATITVVEARLSAASGTDGAFVINGIAAGSYSVKCTARGYAAMSRQVKIAADTTTRLDFVLKPAPAELEETKDKKKEEGRPAPAGKMLMRAEKSAMGYAAPQPSQTGIVLEPQEDFNTEEYDRIHENPFLSAAENPLSTLSIDVDTASYANARRFINSSQLPPKDVVRLEEFINYFRYDYPDPKGEHPFSVNTEITECPWNSKHRLILLGLQGKKVSLEKLPPSNLVFLLDVSGSMASPNKLPLLRQAFKLLVNELRPEDRVAMVVYAGAAGLVLPPTPGNKKDVIFAALDSLNAGGSTAGGAGIKLAYLTAKENFVKNGNNRVILATDGDFNVGASSDAELERMIEKEREHGVFLTVLGFGMGNYKDSKMEKLADKGNGNYAYIDSILEAQKVLVTQMGGTLVTIAKDVKIQVEFNPAKVKGYRLIGYENRLLRKEDFDDDTKDAGEMGAGHTVTVMYEMIAAGSDEELPGASKLKYQEAKISPEAYKSKELMTVKLRYKQPDGATSKLLEHPLVDDDVPLKKTSENLRFAAAVVQFGLVLRDSQFKGSASFDGALALAKGALGDDKEGYRYEFVKLIEKAQLLRKAQ
jgi:Ca-activated chloride channel family protein